MTILPSGDVDLTGGTYEVAPGTALVLDPNESTTVTVDNLIVWGRLTARPAGPDVVHTIRLTGAGAYWTGGGMMPLDTDPGIWVRGAGVLDLDGTRKVAWNRRGWSATWDPDDEVVLTPTADGDYGQRGFDTGFGPSSRLRPSVLISGRQVWPEVLNLSRNVRILGPGHVNIQSAVPQTIRYVELDGLGPRHPTGAGVLGRYPLHFHHCGDGSVGSIVEGVVVRGSGNRAFVPHASHGVTFLDCIAYDVVDTPYWWDRDPGENQELSHANATHGAVWARCVAAHVSTERGADDLFNLSGFYLGEGRHNVAEDCVATAIHGPKGPSGFLWPARVDPDESVWDFSRNVAHNIDGDGFRAWQNTGVVHRVDGSDAYRLSGFGVNAGAYRKAYQYRDLLLEECDGISPHAVSKHPDRSSPLTFERIEVYGERPFVTTEHVQEPLGPTFVRHCHLVPTSGGPVVIIDNDPDGDKKHGDWLVFEGCTTQDEHGVRRPLEESDIFVRSAHEGTKVEVMPGA